MKPPDKGPETGLAATFERMLSGGHPNSLGRVLDVVAMVLADQGKLAALFDCYRSDDATVRLRTSSALKRVFREKRTWFSDYIDRFHALVPALKQPSAAWTLAQLHLEMADLLSGTQRARAAEITRAQLAQCTDWIVIIHSINLLEHWAKEDRRLKAWLVEELKRFEKDGRKSVRKRALRSQAVLARL